MSDEAQLSRLRRAADENHIKFRLQTEEWPSSHRSSFQLIRDVEKHDFVSYQASIGRDSGVSWWKEKTLLRAKWLANEAGRRSLAGANEMSWRLSIENLILQRFLFEVACPNCNHRLWRSDVESDPNSAFAENRRPDRAWTQQVIDRRHGRRTCICPRAERPQDYFEPGTNRLFDDRADQEFLYSNPVGGLSRQKPDRIVGLRATTNIKELLEQPLHDRFECDEIRLGSKIRTSPFAWQPEPMIFPFLVVEAKSDSTKSSFVDIQTQSAFPIRSLLELQRELQSIQGDAGERPAPLVWFMGNKGSVWKVYGCYVSADERDRISYNIHQVWSGDIMDRKFSLQLLLVVDQIMDWARDVFRPSIIAELRSLTTGRELDQVTLGPDADSASLAGNVMLWIPDPTAIIDEDVSSSAWEDNGTTANATDVSRVIDWPEDALGCVRPLSTIKRQFSGLLLSEYNISGLLILGDGTETIGSLRESEECARTVATLFSRWMQVLVVTAADLYNAEKLWNEEEFDVQNDVYQGLETKYYAVFEYRCFLSASWEIIQELSYMAISHVALSKLRRSAAYERKHPLDSFPALAKQCPGSILAEAITCLLSASRSQIAHSAIANTTATFNPFQGSPGNEASTITTILTLGYQKTDHVSAGIRGLLSMASRLPPKRMRGDGREPRKFKRGVSNKLKYVRNGDELLATWEALTADRSFRRFSQRIIRVENEFHLDSQCIRCQKGYPEMLVGEPWHQTEVPSLDAYGAILAAREESDGHDLCLLVDERSSWLDRETAIPVIVEDLLQSGFVLHAVSTGTKVDGPREYIRWNLPVVYRKSTTIQRWRISRWVQHQSHQPLQEEEPPNQDLKTQEEEQMMLHLLRRGFSPDDAGSFIRSWVERTKARPFTSLTLDTFLNDLPTQTSNQTPAPLPNWWVGELLHLKGGI